MVERTIVLKGHDKGHHDEFPSGGAITPGMAIELQTNGTVLQQTGTQARALTRGLLIAKEDGLQGKKITDAYASGDQVFSYRPQEGDHIAAFCKSGINIAFGDVLIVEGAGSGLFVEAADTETKGQLRALETIGVLAANQHVKCEVLAP